jgi:hypothetical protein
MKGDKSIEAINNLEMQIHQESKAWNTIGMTIAKA